MKKHIINHITEGYIKLFEADAGVEFIGEIPGLWNSAAQMLTGLTKEQREQRRAQKAQHKERKNELDEREQQMQEEHSAKLTELSEKEAEMKEGVRQTEMDIKADLREQSKQAKLGLKEQQRALKEKYSDDFKGLKMEVANLKKQLSELETEKAQIISDYETKLKNAHLSEYEISTDMDDERVDMMKDKLKILEEQMKLTRGLDDSPESVETKDQIARELSAAKMDLLRATRAKGQPLTAKNIKAKLSSNDLKTKIKLDKELLNAEKEFVKLNPSANPVNVRDEVFDQVRTAQIRKTLEGKHPEFSESELDQAARAALSKEKAKDNSILNIILGDNARHRNYLKAFRNMGIAEELKLEMPDLDPDSEEFAELVHERYFQYVEQWALED